MPEDKHTRGPWETEQTTLSICQLIISTEEVKAIEVHPHSDTGYVIAYVPNDYEEERQAANACLIAAAPELLEGLRDAVADLKVIYGTTWTGQFAKAEAAIAKAEGRNE